MNTRFFTFFFLYFAAHLRHGLPINSVEKILDGSSTNIEIVPYVLSFMLNDKYACCATIINRHWAATAAHCVTAAKYPLKEITVRSGSSLLYEGGTVHKVTHTSVHQNYNDITHDYDIAVIKVMPPFIYGNSTKPVNLAQSDAEDIYTKWGTICGWGYYMKIHDYIDPVLPKKLQCILLPLVPKGQCYEDYKFKYMLTSRMTCYGFQEGTIDSCKGDSGAALVNRYGTLLGITSWGEGCGDPNSPGVYTDAIVLQNWIKDETKIHT